jgi:tight adherence protein C
MEIVLLLIFASIVALGVAGMSLGRRPEQERLAKLASGEQAAVSADGVLTRNDPGIFEKLMGVFAGDVESKEREESLGPIRRRLIHAGYRRETAVMTYMGSRIAFAMAIPLAVLVLPVSWSLSQLQLVTALCACAGLGLVAPSYWLDRKVRKRQRAIELALPDSLDLMVVCVEAGLGINASLKRIADDFRTSHPLLASEFELANFETRAGKSTTEALRGLADRTGVSDVSSLVAMLIQTERFGTGLADTLRVHADGMRVRRLQRAEEQANLAPLKMLFPTVFIFIAMIIIIMGPGALQMAQYFSNRG